MNKKYVITFDMDWAPDFLIDDIAEILVESRVKATWFVTHECSALRRLRSERELFELGLHPNFFSSSTQGESHEDVILNLKSVVPEATAVRTHGLYQSGRILNLFIKAGICTDVSTYLPRVQNPGVFQFQMGQRSIQRLPYTWSDDYELMNDKLFWSVEAIESLGDLVVMNFHPVLVGINAQGIAAYENLKKECGEMAALRRGDFDKYVQKGYGLQNVFRDIIRRIPDGESYRVSDVGIKNGGKYE